MDADVFDSLRSASAELKQRQQTHASVSKRDNNNKSEGYTVDNENNLYHPQRHSNDKA